MGTPTRLVADDAVGRAQHVAVAEVGAGEQPVLGTVDDETSDASRRSVAEAVVETERRTGAQERPLRPTDERVGPHARHRLGLAVGDHRVVEMGAVLVTHHVDRRRRRALDADLPEHRVAGERHEVGRPSDVRLDGVALRRRPVLVVTDADDDVVAVDQPSGRSSRSVETAMSNTSADPLGPLDEPAAVREPSGGPDRRRVGVLGSVRLEDQAVGVGRFVPPTGRDLRSSRSTSGRQSIPRANGRSNDTCEPPV